MKNFIEWTKDQFILGHLWISKSYRYPNSLAGDWTIKYHTKKNDARKKGIKFSLTFEEYLKLLHKAGIEFTEEVSHKSYHLARHMDNWGYSFLNCRFISCKSNMAERDEHFPPWNRGPITENSVNTWKIADKVYRFKKESKRVRDFKTHSESAYQSISKRIKNGWIPTEDKEWVKWRDTHGVVW